MTPRLAMLLCSVQSAAHWGEFMHGRQRAIGLAPSLLIAAALIVFMADCGGDSDAASTGAPATAVTARSADSPEAAALYGDRLSAAEITALAEYVAALE